MKNNDVEILEFNRKRYLHNRSTSHISSITVSSRSFEGSGDDEPIISDPAIVEMKDLSPGELRWLEDVNQWEDGAIFWVAKSIAWDDGHEDVDVSLNQREVWGGSDEALRFRKMK